jgi:hypothetical protein
MAGAMTLAVVQDFWQSTLIITLKWAFLAAFFAMTVDDCVAIGRAVGKRLDQHVLDDAEYHGDRTDVGQCYDR